MFFNRKFLNLAYKLIDYFDGKGQRAITLYEMGAKPNEILNRLEIVVPHTRKKGLIKYVENLGWVDIKEEDDKIIIEDRWSELTVIFHNYPKVENFDKVSLLRSLYNDDKRLLIKILRRQINKMK